MKPIPTRDLEDLSQWHWEQATGWRKAADSSPAKRKKTLKKHLYDLADWHDLQKLMINAVISGNTDLYLEAMRKHRKKKAEDANKTPEDYENED